MGAFPDLPVGNTTINRLLKLQSLAHRRDATALGAVQSADPLYLGPVLAEFGHELFLAAQARYAARYHPETVVCSRPSRAALYADFCTKFVPHDIECESSILWPTPTGSVSSGQTEKYATPAGHSVLPQIEYTGTQQQVKRAEFVVYGQRDKEFEGVTVIHARSRPHVAARNWPVRCWESLVRGLREQGIADRIVCIGAPGHSLAIEGCEDMRSLPLHRQMDLLRSARLAVGPSSGPMHLASLCKCPHVVWCGGAPSERSNTAARYRERWNPHKTPCAAVQYATWRPTAEHVLEWVVAFAKARGGLK